MSTHTATATTSTTVTDASAALISNYYSGQYATVITGDASGNTMLIYSNTATVLTMRDPGISNTATLTALGSRNPPLTAGSDGLYIISPNTNAVAWKSTDGVTWTSGSINVTPNRRDHGTAFFNNYLWLVGGNGNRDVWRSSDGFSWTEIVDPASFTTPSYVPIYLVSFNSKLWVLGAGSAGNEAWWTTDGSTWTQSCSSIDGGTKSSRLVFAATPTRMYAVDGAGHTWYTTDGTTWTTGGTGGWVSKYSLYNLVVTGETVLFIGGDPAAYNWVGCEQVWYTSDGLTWSQGLHLTQDIGINTTASYHTGIAATEYNGKWYFVFSQGTGVYQCNDLGALCTSTYPCRDLVTKAGVVVGCVTDLAGVYGGDLMEYNNQIYGITYSGGKYRVSKLFFDGISSITSNASELHVGGVAGGSMLFFAQVWGDPGYTVDTFWYNGSTVTQGPTLDYGDTWVGRSSTASDGNVYVGINKAFGGSGHVFKFTGPDTSGTPVILCPADDSFDNYHIWTDVLSGVVTTGANGNRFYWYDGNTGSSGSVNAPTGTFAKAAAKCGDHMLLFCNRNSQNSKILICNHPSDGTSTLYTMTDGSYIYGARAVSEDSVVILGTDKIWVYHDGWSEPKIVSTTVYPAVDVVYASSTTYFDMDWYYPALYKTTPGSNLAYERPRFEVGDSFTLTDPPVPYLVTLLDSCEQYPVTSGSVTVGAITVSADTSGVAEMSGLSSGENIFTVAAPRYSTIILAKTVDDTITGTTTIYVERSFSDGGVI